MAQQLPALPSPSAYDIAEKSNETFSWLQNNVKVGFTSERGPAWWARDASQNEDGSWSGLPEGSHFDGPVPIEEVKRLLDVRLVKGIVHVTYEDTDGHKQVASDAGTTPVVNQRTGQIFCYPTKSYKIHPYLRTLHGFIESILHDEKAAVGSVGLLKKGGQAFLQAVLPEHYEVAGYGYQPYIMAVTSADQSRATGLYTGGKGGVCDNTVTSAISEALTRFKIRHTRNSDLRVQMAREKLGIQLVTVAEDIAAGIEGLLNVDVSDKEFEAWMDLAAELPEPQDKLGKNGQQLGPGREYTMRENRRNEYVRLWDKDPKVAPWRGTGFGILQLDNTYRTWTGIVRNAQGGRLERNLTNDANGKTEKADTLALDLLAQVKERKMTFA